MPAAWAAIPRVRWTRLLVHAEATRNTKLLDLAQQVLTRYSARLEAAVASDRQERIDALRARCGHAPARAMLGQGTERKPGELVLRGGRAPAPAAARGGTSPPAQEAGADEDAAGMLRLRPV